MEMRKEKSLSGIKVENKESAKKKKEGQKKKTLKCWSLCM